LVFVGVVLGGQSEPAEVFMRFKRSLQPLLYSFAAPSGGFSEESLEDAITSYCTRLWEAFYTDASSIAEKYEEVRRAFDVSATIAFLSWTTIAVQDRLIKDRMNLFRFVFSTVSCVLKA